MADATLLPLPVPRHALTRPEHPALVVDRQVWTYGRLSAEADALALRLAAGGLGPGDRLAVCLPSGLLFAALFHAAARLGAVLVPLNTRLTASELDWHLADSDPTVVVWAPELADRLPAVPARAALIASESAARGATGAGGGGGARAKRTRRALADAPTLADLSPPDPTLADPSPVRLADAADVQAPAAIVYTSGTSGRPKGAVLTHGNFLWSAAASALRLGIGADDRWLLPLPLFHVGGLAVLARSALAGTTAEVHGRFEAARVAAALASGNVSLASLVPTMLTRVLEVWDRRPVPRRLRGILLGGGPVPVDLLRRAGAVGLPVAATYGLTEAASQVATAPPTTSWPEAGVGAAPLAFTAVRVVDDAGRACPSGVVGEIRVRGPTVMVGYWNDAPATAAALVDGWLRTGDAGWLDEAGRLHVADRRDDLILCGGENVYPAEVEAVLEGHPEVAESCVVGVPDSEWGQVVAAVVVRRSDDLTPEALAEHARRHLAGYKVPRRIEWADALPRTAAGKLRRSEVRARLTDP